MTARACVLAWLLDGRRSSVRKLADDSGHTESAIRSALHTLTMHGLVERSGPWGRYRYALVKR